MRILNNPKFSSFLLLLVGLALAYVEVNRIERANHQELQASFDRLSQRIITALNYRIRTYEYGLRGARGAILSAGGLTALTREHYRQYGESRDAHEFPGARGFSVVERVKPQDEARFVARMRRTDWPDFNIRQFAPHDQDRYVVRYSIPEADGLRTIGLDQASETERRSALMRAVRSGQATLSPPLTLVRANTKPEQGFLMYLPVFRNGAYPDTPPTREAQSTGAVLVPFVISEALLDLDPDIHQVTLDLVDITTSTQSERFYSYAQGQPDASALSSQKLVPLYGRTWKVNIRAMPAFAQSHPLPDPTLRGLLIAALTSLLAAFLYWYLRSTTHAQQLRLASELVNAMPHAMVVTDDQFRITRANARLGQLFGYEDTDALLGVPLERLLPGCKRSTLEQSTTADDRQPLALRGRSHDGSAFPVETTEGPVSLNNEPHHIITISDVTQRRQAEAILRRNKEALDSAQRIAQVGSWEWNIEAGQLNWSDECFRILGLMPGQATANYDTYIEATHPDDRDRVQRALRLSLKGLQKYLIQHRIVRPDGEQRIVEETAEFERNEKGRALRMVGVMHDITERLHTEQQLRQAKETAEAASRAKSDFLANMSHEIRTPLNAVLGMSHLLHETRLDNRQKTYLRNIEGASTLLLGVINDVLDFSKIEAGKLDLETTPFDLSDVLHRLAAVATSAAADKDLDILFQVDPRVPHDLIGDSLRLGQILVNLTNNAIKFTERGEVIVRVDLQDSDGSQAWLAFSVADTGVGMTSTQVGTLFQAFSQADASTTRRFGGTGLGLAISRRLVELMGGELSVESEYQRGSTFRFLLPLRRQSREDKAWVQVPENMRDLHVLIVDRNPAVRMTIYETVHAFGWDAVALDSEAKALERLTHVGSRPFDLLLMGMRKFNDDSLHLLHQVADALGQHSQARIVLIANAMDESQWQQQLDVGTVAGVLTKPFTPSNLFDTVSTAFYGQAVRPPPSARTAARLPSAGFPGARILVAEDNATNQLLISELLRRKGASVTMAKNGEECLRLLLTAPVPYDLILMDMQMPEMDGIEATLRIRHDLKLADIPIVALTANAMAHDRQRCEDAGMNDFIPKPIDPQQLHNTLARFLGGNANQEDNTDNDVALPRLPELPGVDMRAALLRLDGDTSLYAWVLTAFADEHRVSLPLIRAQIEQAQPREPTARLVHTAKGHAGTIGAAQLAIETQALEHMLLNDAPTSECLEQLARVEALLLPLLAAIDASGLRANAPPESLHPQ